jgi:hypothetical protein
MTGSSRVSLGASLLVSVLWVACGGPDSSEQPTGASAGTTATGGGTTASGGSGGTRDVGGAAGTGGAGAMGGTQQTGGVENTTGGSCPEAAAAPMGSARSCFGDACPYGECDDLGVAAARTCVSVYPGPLGDGTPYCREGVTGGYCLMLGVGICTDVWSVNCAAGAASISLCAEQDRCTVSSGSSSLCQ